MVVSIVGSHGNSSLCPKCSTSDPPLTNGLGKAVEDCLTAWALDILVGDPHKTHGSQLWPGQPLANEVIYETTSG